jgi:hypothetical protein
VSAASFGVPLAPSPPLARVPFAGWLVPRSSALAVAPGVPVPVPAFGVARAVVSLSPGGMEWTLWDGFQTLRAPWILNLHRVTT